MVKELVGGVDVATLLHNGYLLLFREEGGVLQAASLSPDGHDGDDEDNNDDHQEAANDHEGVDENVLVAEPFLFLLSLLLTLRVFARYSFWLV